MAETTGNQTAERLKELLESSRGFSFYQAVQWVHLLWPEAPRVGQEGPVDEERVRLRPSPSLSFPSTDLEGAEVIHDGKRVRLTATFFGLYGADTPLPYAYAEHLAQIATERAGERVRAFLDIFHHRMLSLLFRAWEKYRPRARASGGMDPLYARVLSFIGYSHEQGLGGPSMPPLAEVRLQVLRHRSAVGLRFLLERRLGYDVEVDQMVLRDVPIPEDQRSRMGVGNCELGTSLVVGRTIKDRNKIRVRILARDFAMYRRLLPGAEDFRQIEEVLRRYLRSPVDHDVEVKLPPENIPEFRLGSEDVQLGQSTFLGNSEDGFCRRWSPSYAAG